MRTNEGGNYFLLPFYSNQLQNNNIKDFFHQVRESPLHFFNIFIESILSIKQSAFITFTVSIFEAQLNNELAALAAVAATVTRFSVKLSALVIAAADGDVLKIRTYTLG